MDTSEATGDGTVRTAIADGHTGLLTADEQCQIRQASLLIAGCGVGSVVAVSAVRMGFEKLRIVDGDLVEAGNLNRQAYSASDIGKSKAEALAAILIGINPACQVNTVPYYVDTQNAVQLVAGMDIIVDAIDPTSAKAIFALHRAARQQGRPIISPLDLGWGGTLQVLLPEESSMAEIAGIDDGNLEEISEELLVGALLTPLMVLIPDYLRPAVASYMEGSLRHFPQPVSGALISSALTVTAAMRLALGLPLNTDPKLLWFDPGLVHEAAYSS